MNKKQKTAQLLARYKQLFYCPICQESVHVIEATVTCANGHLFDIAKKGYVNFYGKPSPADYDKHLFEARYQVIQSGMYAPLHDKLGSLLQGTHLLDIGCGEGSHLAQITARRQQQTIGIGFDISKAGITTAAKYHPGHIWAVADLADSPFQTKKFDVLLNILSPANYQEFERLLAPNGLVLKVIPRANYLREIREQVLTIEKVSYDNTDTIAHFKERFPETKSYSMQYQWEIPEKLADTLWQMTPLTWGKERHCRLSSVTVDLEVLIGKSR